MLSAEENVSSAEKIGIDKPFIIFYNKTKKYKDLKQCIIKKDL